MHQFIKCIIVGLENIGFKVVCVVSDNNAINKTMSMFADPPKVSIVYQHPSDPARPLFFIIDAVHLLKCIRNNWLNQKNKDQCMYFPNFDNFCNVSVAAFEALKLLHKTESMQLLKYAYGLTLKAFYPTNLECQNVKLALQVFNPRVAEGLIIVGQNEKALLRNS